MKKIKLIRTPQTDGPVPAEFTDEQTKQEGKEENIQQRLN